MVNEFRDDRTALRNYLRNYNGFMIHFNGIRYDFAVLTYLDQNNWFINNGWVFFCEQAKQFSDDLINTQDDLFVYKYTNHPKFNKITHIDLYLYWAKLLRVSKKISLKGLGIQLNYPVVQELPYPSDIKSLTKEQIDEIHHYCSVHDLGILRKLTHAFEGNYNLGNLGTIQLRGQIVKDYGINAWSMDGPKIASEALLNAYCKITRQDKKSVSKIRFDRPTIRFKDIFKDVEFNFITEPFISVYNQWMNSIDTFSKEFVVFSKNGHGLKISCGVGGIHSINNNEIYVSTDTHIVVTDDIAAMYPTNIINWNAFRFPEVLDSYVDFKDQRTNITKPGMKKSVKGSNEYKAYQQKDTFIKLVLNGVSGHLDSEHSWLYNPEGIMKVRCGGQLILLVLIEQCLLAGYDVISCNTDGLEVIVPRDQLDDYINIVNQVGNKYNVMFEREYYKKIVYSHVNSYIAIKENGEIKQKGEFITNPELGSSTDFLIIPNLLNDYFVKGIKPEDAIKEYKDIFLYCASQKVDKSYYVEWNNQKIPQRLNRYYVSRRGSYLYKCREGKKHHMLKGQGVMLYNQHIEQDFSKYQVYLPFYLKQVNDMISKLENHQQLQLF